MEGGCMDSLVKVGDGIMRKQRSNMSRGPRREHESITIKRDENTGFDSGPLKKELNINQHVLKFPSSNNDKTDPACKRIGNGDKIVRESDGTTGNGPSKSIAEKGQSRQDFRGSNGSMARKNVSKITGKVDLHHQKVDTSMDTGKSGKNRSLSCSNGSEIKTA